MNTIDTNFYSLMDSIEKQSLEEVYNSIINNFKKISLNIQNSIEDFINKFPYWGKLNIKKEDYEELYNRAIMIKKHNKELRNLYENLNDYRSKKVLLSIINNLYNFDFISLNNSIEKNYPHYFDLDLVKCSKEEVVVDLGAFTGDTILDYLNYYGVDNYKNIYCYEITKDIFEKLENNLKYYPNIHCIRKAISDKCGELYIKESNIDKSANIVVDNGDIKIEATTIDEDIKEKISLIKMDIEGFEQKALKGCIKHIQNDHPKLLISVYHNHEDLWKIPCMINEICPGYKFYLRYYGNNIFPTEIVLICIYS